MIFLVDKAKLCHSETKLRQHHTWRKSNVKKTTKKGDPEKFQQVEIFSVYELNSVLKLSWNEMYTKASNSLWRKTLVRIPSTMWSPNGENYPNKQLLG